MRNLVIFDGSNFYLRAKKLLGRSLGGFDYTKFSKLLTGRGVNEVHYCIGEIRFIPNDAKNLRLYDGQQKLFHNLISHGVTIHRGYLLKNDSVYIEIGVDVRIAIEMLVGALKDRYDRLFLVSSDTDLIPAIQEVRNEKRRSYTLLVKGHQSAERSDGMLIRRSSSPRRSLKPVLNSEFFD